MGPTISIVMPVFNRADTIEKAIKSVLDQHYEPIELIIIDGGSTDGTVDIIRRYEKYIAYWHSQPDGNPAIAYNMGIEKATGDLVALLMADDWYEPNTLQKIGEACLANPQADMFTCAGRIVYYDQKTQSYKPHWVYATAKELELNLYNICFAVSAICCRFIRKSLYNRIGLYEPYNSQGKYVLSNDKAFLIRAVLQGAKNIFVNHPGHTYLSSPSSSTFGNHYANILRLCHEHMETAAYYLKQPSLTFKQKCLFKYWYSDQAIRLMLYGLLNRDFRAALTMLKEGLKKNPFFWLIACWCTPSVILAKKSRRLVGKLFN